MNLALIIETLNVEPKQRLKHKIIKISRNIPIATEKDGGGCVFYELLWSRQIRKWSFKSRSFTKIIH